MKRYRIVKNVVFSFVVNGEQVMTLFRGGDPAIVECDGKSVWVIDESMGLRKETIDIPLAVENYVQNGDLAEI